LLCLSVRVEMVGRRDYVGGLASFCGTFSVLSIVLSYDYFLKVRGRPKVVVKGASK
jgi:hypothetical protein